MEGGECASGWEVWKCQEPEPEDPRLQNPPHRIRASLPQARNQLGYQVLVALLRPRPHVLQEQSPEMVHPAGRPRHRQSWCRRSAGGGLSPRGLMLHMFTATARGTCRVNHTQPRTPGQVGGHGGSRITCQESGRKKKQMAGAG